VRRDDRVARHRPRTDHSPSGRRSEVTVRCRRCSATAETAFRPPWGSLAGRDPSLHRSISTRAVRTTWYGCTHIDRISATITVTVSVPVKTRLNGSVPHLRKEATKISAGTCLYFTKLERQLNFKLHHLNGSQIKQISIIVSLETPCSKYMEFLYGDGA
jgi:hypothetical protein